MEKLIEDKVNALAAMITRPQAFASVRNNLPRVGSFTSSEIVALTKEGKKAGTFGAAATTYIAETNMERRLQRSLTDECGAHPLVWGKFLEPRVNDLLPDHTLCSNETVVHPSINFWSGSPDGFKIDGTGKTVTDIKCPLTLKSFCQLVDPLYSGLTGIDAMNAIRENHKDGEKFYWQLVSNAILSNSKFAELIVYMPYLSELPEIQLAAMGVQEDQLTKHAWIAYAGEGELPYLLDGGYYSNINIIRFEVPETDKALLTTCVMKAGAMLEGYTPAGGLKATYDKENGVTLVEAFDVNQIQLIKI